MRVLVTVDTAVGFLSAGTRTSCNAKCPVIRHRVGLARIFFMFVFSALRCFTRWRDVLPFLL